MKFCLQLNPQVSIDKPAAQLMPTLIEQVRVADAVGFDAFSMGDHYNIPGLQRLNQVPALARLCAEAKRCAVGTAVMLLGLRHPVTVASELAAHFWKERAMPSIATSFGGFPVISWPRK